MLVFPGGALGGDTRVTEDFSFASQYSVLQLETNPDDPYSVNLLIVVIDGKLYIDAAPGRRWHRYIEENPHVRVRIGGHVYPAIARHITDPKIVSRFLPGRTIYRLDPENRAP